MMNMRLTKLAGFLVFSAVFTLLPSPSRAAVKTEVRKTAIRRGVSVAPLPPGEKVKWSHAPYEGGDCGVCHERNDAKNPGPIRHSSVNEQCFECHEDSREVMSRRYKHVPAVEACTDCHNPHNSTERGLLAAEMVSLCLSCHQGIKDQVTKSQVKHDAITQDKKCSNCHNPHAANVEKLLIQLPFDLCVNCHSKDGMTADDGRPMTNYKKWLSENKEWHAPVKAKDCSACHRTHGGDNFRLLVAAYPSSFYAPYETKNYALCYGCHNSKVVSEPETTTLTGFRDGSKNLHYVHVHKERGRTCRACHEVHASKQDHHIREGVPYGPKGWMLKINFTKLPTGGSCAKTCHETKAYNNKSLTAGQ
jgi:predicted CXXCH cytochrome family protein